MEATLKLHKTHKNEIELCTINYDEVSNLLPDSSKGGSRKPSSLGNQSNVAISLEVEIADSLKQLIASPEKYNTSLLDVTIIRPTDLNCVPGIENASIKSNEIRNLIASMERQKQQKRKLIDEFRKNAMDVQEIKLKHEKKLKRSEKRALKNIEVLSDYAKTTKTVEPKPFANSTPISVLKPLMGEIRQSLKNLEKRIVEVGDHCTSTKASPTSNSSSYNSEEVLKRKRAKKHLRKLSENVRHRNQHVYTTVNTFDHLRTLLTCQNDKRDPENDKPCLCQHCGMIGLLVESQKRPVMPGLPMQDPEDTRPQTEHHNLDSTDSNIDEQYYIIRELAIRLQELEKRIAAQEKSAVPKEYFKHVIKKILDMQNTISQHDVNTKYSTKPARHATTQHSLESSDVQNTISQHNVNTKYPTTPGRHATTQYGLESSDGRRSKGKVKQRNVQIQQGYCKRYMINPVAVETETSPDLNVGNKAFSIITDFFARLGQDKNPNSNSKLTTLGSFWKWGEEIIKPGIDLKSKILNLLDEKLLQVKVPEKSTLENKAPSSRTVHKVLNLMSEKIYSEHVKPTVDAIKSEQNHLNKENRKKLTHMKAEMEAFIKLNAKKSPTSTRKKKSSLDADSRVSKAHRSGIPIRVANTSVADLFSSCPKYNIKNSLIPKLKSPNNVSHSDNFDRVTEDKPAKNKTRSRYRREEKAESPGKNIKVTYMNPKVTTWNEDSLASVPATTSDESNVIQLRSSNSLQSKIERSSGENATRRLFSDNSITDKLEFLKSVASSEITKTQLWANIWNQAKTYCKSKNDTVIIQIPTKMQSKHVGITEVEFTIEEIQKLVNDPKLLRSIDKTPNQNHDKENMERFLLIRSKRNS